MDEKELAVLDEAWAPTERARNRRWGALLEGFEDAAKATTAPIESPKRRIADKKRACERMLDQQLRAFRGVYSADGRSGPMLIESEGIVSAFKHMSDFAVAVERGDLQESTTTIGWIAPGSVPVTDKIFTTQSFGMIARVFPRLLMTELVSVQPMVQPTGKVFFRDAKYGDAYGSVGVGDRLDDSSAWSVRDMQNYASTQRNSTNSATPEGITARRIHQDISSLSVDAEAKKLAYSWSREAQQDYRAYHGIDAEVTLDQDALDEIVREVDRTMIDFVFTTAYSAGAGIVTWNRTPTSTLPTEVRAHNETLVDAVEDASVLIQNARYKKPQWLLCSTAVAARFRKMNGFRSLSKMDDTEGSIGTGARSIYGAVDERWVIYADPWFHDNTIVVGYKGSSMVDAGIAYCPYIPFYRTESFEDPSTFVNTKGIMSRFGKIAMVPKMYAIVSIVGS